jgi:hypothetical protein
MRAHFIIANKTKYVFIISITNWLMFLVVLSTATSSMGRCNVITETNGKKVSAMQKVVLLYSASQAKTGCGQMLLTSVTISIVCIRVGHKASPCTTTFNDLCQSA